MVPIGVFLLKTAICVGFKFQVVILAVGGGSELAGSFDNQTLVFQTDSHSFQVMARAVLTLRHLPLDALCAVRLFVLFKQRQPLRVLFAAAWLAVQPYVITSAGHTKTGTHTVDRIFNPMISHVFVPCLSCRVKYVDVFFKIDKSSACWTSWCFTQAFSVAKTSSLSLVRRTCSLSLCQLYICDSCIPKSLTNTAALATPN